MKSMKWLLIALVVVGGLWGGLELKDRSKAGPKPLYTDFKQDAVAKITLKNPQSTAVLEKHDGVWLVTSEDSLPAEADFIGEMLVTIAAFSRKDKISSNPEKQALYQVDSSGTAVTVEDAKNKAVASFVVGKTGPDYQSTYVRDTKSNDVILAQGYFSHIFNRRNRSWQDKRIFVAEPGQVVEVGIARAGVTTVLMRAAEGGWYVNLPESTACDQDRVSGLVRALASLRCEDFAGRKPQPDWGVDDPDSSVYFKMASGDLHTLFIGHQAEGERFYVASAQDGPVYLVAKRTVKALLPPVADLLPKQGGEPEEGAQ